MGKQHIYRKTDVLSASEIGQCRYCSTSWFLHRCGYEPESLFLEPGKQMHVDLGNTIDNCAVKMRHARWYAIIGLVVLCAAFLLLLFGVIK